MAEIGYYNGKHHTDYLPEILELLDRAAFRELIRLVTKLLPVIEAESQATGARIHPWVYDVLACAYLSVGRHGDEMRVYERYAWQRNVTDRGFFSERLERVRGMLVV